MKALIPKLIPVLLASFSLNAVAATTRYVDLNSPSPTPPYTNWLTAATNIQDAIDVAVAGDLVLVTNGVYQTGGRAVFGTMTNRVAVEKPLTLLSANGPEKTIISGAPAGSGGVGDGSIRCLLLVSNAVLSGFTLTNGYTRSSGDAVAERSGGGVWCEPGAIIRNAVIVGNSANGDGGGAYRGTFYNCEITRNLAANGGGAYGGMLYNCTVVTNRVSGRSAGAGTALCTNYNSVVHFNYSTSLANYSQSTFFSSCTTPLPTSGTGNITNTPGFVDLKGGILRLQCGSPCIDTGIDLSALFNDDLRGHPRPVDGNGDGSASFDMGAYERNIVFDAQDIGIRSDFTNVALLFLVTFVAQLDGCVTNFWWDFGDGSVTSNKYEVMHAWAASGTYPVILTAQFGQSGVMASVTNTAVVVDATRYVDASNPTPVFPYSSWATAATNIQDAVDAGAELGRTVMVTNGIYRQGGIALFGTMTNRVTLTNAVRLQSVNGPANTVIEGAQSTAGGNGDGAVRCLYVAQLCVVSGFTITNGHTLISTTADTRFVDGGGIWSETSGLITNCIVVGNSSHHQGAGARGGRLYDCVLAGNVGQEGGGAIFATLSDCVLRNNFAVWAGGGGAAWSTLYGCVVVGNATPEPAGGGTGGVDGCTVYNSIVYGNSGGNWGGGALSYFISCCTTPLPAGLGNISQDPHFVNQAIGDFHLQSNSPCINAGNNGYVADGLDLDGNLRMTGGTVDIGAYEFQSPPSVLSYAWAQQNGLPTDGSADFTDADGDGMNNYGEWRSDTNPTNSLSSLRMLNATNSLSGKTVTWQSVATRNYWLERASNLELASPFQTVATNIVGVAGLKTFTDTSATNGGPYFYRVGVQ